MEKRNKTIDIIRGFAVFLVLWGHVIQYFTIDGFAFYDNYLYKLIYSFHMPLFMIVSGYLFFNSVSKHSFRTLISKRVKSLGWAMIIWGGAYNLILQILYVLMQHEKISVITLYKSLFSSWFIWSVLLLSVITAGVEKKVKTKSLKSIMYIISIIIISMLPCAEYNLFMFPYFILGYIVANRFQSEKNFPVNKHLDILSTILFLGLLSMYKSRDLVYVSGVNPFKSNEGILTQVWIDIYRWIVGLLGIIVSTEGIRYLVRKKGNNSLAEWLETIGKYSLQIYLLQKVILEFLGNRTMSLIVQKLGWNPLTTNIHIYNFILTPIITVLYAISIVFIIKIIEKMKLSKLLFGR